MRASGFRTELTVFMFGHAASQARLPDVASGVMNSGGFRDPDVMPVMNAPSRPRKIARQ